MSEFIKQFQSILSQHDFFIFDFDGTIADTERHHWNAFNELLSCYNITLDKEKINQYIGNSEEMIYKMIKNDFKIEFDNDSFLSRRLTLYFEMINDQNVKPFDYFDTIIRKYPKKTYAILSSQRIEVLNTLLEKWDIKHLFKYIISVSEGNLTKKHYLENPDLYFNISHDKIIVFEDSNKNLKIAKELGITTIGILNEYNNDFIIDCDYKLSVL